LVANSSHSGSLSESELGSALVNADYSAFDPYTIKMMMRMFSTAPRLDFVAYEEFVDLWRLLAEWRGIFERFDEDHSRIQLSCLCTAESYAGSSVCGSATPLRRLWGPRAISNIFLPHISENLMLRARCCLGNLFSVPGEIRKLTPELKPLTSYLPHERQAPSAFDQESLQREPVSRAEGLAGNRLLYGSSMRLACV
jgi:hypothetical protein